MASTSEWRAKNKDRLRDNLRRWRARKRLEAIARGEIVSPEKSARRAKWQRALNAQSHRTSEITRPRPEKALLRFSVTDSDISLGNSAVAFSAAFLRGCERAAPNCKPQDLAPLFLSAAESGGLVNWDLSGLRFVFRIKEFPEACRFVLSESPTHQEFEMYVCVSRQERGGSLGHARKGNPAY